MKKTVLLLGILPLFFGFVSAHDCLNLDKLLDAIESRQEEYETRAYLYEIAASNISSQYQYQQLVQEYKELQELSDEIISDLDYAKSEDEQCQVQRETYNSLIAEGTKWLDQLDSKGYDGTLLNNAMNNWKRAYNIAKERNLTNSSKLADLKSRIDEMEDLYNEQEAKIKAEQKAKKEAEEKAKKEQEEAARVVAQLEAIGNYEDAKKYLGWKTSILDSFVKEYKSRGEKKMAKLRTLATSFSKSKDTYTKHIGNYILYSLDN